MAVHQYLERGGAIVDEELFGDVIVRFLYSSARERAPWLLKALTSAWTCELLALLNFDSPLGFRLLGNKRFLRACGVDLEESYDDPRSMTTARKIFERRIRYWEYRPLPKDDLVVAAPCDGRVLVGSMRRRPGLKVKETFFLFDELIERERWRSVFAGGDYAITRLTPDKYHYNHSPVTGVVEDIYALDGSYHACNPSAVVELVTPYSKNKRVVTVIDTDIPGGTRVGKVAMVEVAALMIGDVVQRFSKLRYDDPREVRPGMLLERGQPKSLYRPGSSTTILLFEPGRVIFWPDLLANRHAIASTRFAQLGESLVETDVRVRSPLASRRPTGRGQ